HHQERGERAHRAMELHARRDLRRDRRLHAGRPGAGNDPAHALDPRRVIGTRRRRPRQRPYFTVELVALPPKLLWTVRLNGLNAQGRWAWERPPPRLVSVNMKESFTVR